VSYVLSIEKKEKTIYMFDGVEVTLQACPITNPRPKYVLQKVSAKKRLNR
jgi:hypothetical protein